MSDNKNSDVTGEELHLRFLAGNKGAFEELVRLYERELSIFIRGMVHDTYRRKKYDGGGAFDFAAFSIPRTARKEESPIAIYHLSIQIFSRGKGHSAVKP